MRRPLTTALAAAVLALVPTAAAEGALPWAPCQPEGFQCASLDVPLDRTGRVPGTVGLNATRLPAPAGGSSTAVVALAGGPGQAAVPLASAFADGLLPGVRAGRDLLVFDQRGTGGSSQLGCAALRRGGSSLSVAARCASEIGPARGLFRTADSVEDLEALRVAGGYSKLALYGVSYGTKVALAYAAAHPANVESLVLDSVVLPEGPDPLRASSLGNVNRVLSELCAGGECRGITPSAVADARKLASRLRDRALRGTVVSSSGRRRRISVGESGLFNVLLAGDLNPTLRAELPGSMRAALTGDPQPLLRLAVRSAGLEMARGGFQSAAAADSDAVFLATICEEAPFRWTRTAGPQQRAREITAAARTLRDLGPFSRDVALGSGLAPTCLGWPNAAAAPAAPGPLPNVPTLVIEGRGDLRTPLPDGEALRGRIPATQVLAVPFVGHSVLGSDPSRCGETAVAAFFAGQPVAPCTATDNPFSPTPKPPRRLSGLRAAGGVAGDRGRTLAALLATVTDARRQVIGATLAGGGRSPSAVGGLRGGRATVGQNTIALRRYEYVPGVRVTGAFEGRQAGRFQISGSGARGTVTLADTGAFSGTLGGRRLSGTTATAAATPDALPTLRQARRLARLRG
jgi:pimeloyl-ACP methyl ester carboxylesterase